jgi:hypothetical protein
MVYTLVLEANALTGLQVRVLLCALLGNSRFLLYLTSDLHRNSFADYCGDVQESSGWLPDACKVLHIFVMRSRVAFVYMI